MIQHLNVKLCSYVSLSRSLSRFLALSLNRKRESPVKAFWGHWLTYVEKHKHTHIVSPVTLCLYVWIMQWSVTAAELALVWDHTQTHTLAHKKLHSWGVGTQWPSVSVCVSVYVHATPLTPGFRRSSAGFPFPLHAANLPMMPWHVSKRKGSMPKRQSPTSLLPQQQALDLPLSSSLIQFSLASFISA